MFQDFQRVTQNEAADVAIDIKDGAGVALTGLTSTDVRVVVLKHDGTSFDGKSVDSTTFQEISGGRYLISFIVDELDTTGVQIIRVTPDPGYVGTMRPSIKPLEVADAPNLDGGLTQDRDAWIPILFEDPSEVAVGGKLAADVSTSSFRKTDDTSFTTITLTTSNFREVLDVAAATGIYQVRLPGTSLDELGLLDLLFDGATFEAFSSSYRIIKATTRPVFIEVQDMDLEANPPLSGITIHATSLNTNLVVDTKTTDGLGQTLMDLPDGEYRMTLSNGTEIFHVNNLKALIQDPDLDIEDATAATIMSGNQAPFSFNEADTLNIRINGGENQKIPLNAADFTPHSLISSAAAEVLAEVLNLKGHSFTARAGGLNYKFLTIDSDLVGSSSSVKVEGGAANTPLNFSTDQTNGTAKRRVINSFLFNGSSFVPPFPSPPTDTVEMTYRVVDLEGNPVKGQCVQIINEFSPALRASDNTTAVLGRKVLQFFTDNDGILSDPILGKPRLMKGAVVSVVIKGTGITRQGITVPNTNFNLVDRVELAEDIFTIQMPNLPSVPKF